MNPSISSHGPATVRVALFGVLLAAALLAFASVAKGDKPAEASTLGGLNLTGYCRSVYGQPGQFFAQVNAKLVNYNVYGWRCQLLTGYGWGQLTGIDTNAACRWQYGSSAKSTFRKHSDPYSWYCYR